ncbi:MAG: lamin tail domain-containing protein [Vicingus serpentipes]|nr:lamin tail domain-containing protein [Vicingus serpentipes]
MTLKYLIILVLTCVSHIVAAQLIDNFSDSNFSVNPAWSGDTNFYEVDTTYQLHLNAVAQADVSFLSTPSTAINNATWEFLVKMDFNPSSSNYAKVYLVANQANLKNTLNGYFVKIGNTADEISLYRQDGLVETKIIDGIDNRLNTLKVNCRIKVTRDSLGAWQVFSDTTGSTNFTLEGGAFDNTYNSSLYFGVFSKYTSTRSTLFYYDDFNVLGDGFIDNTPPQLDSLLVIDEKNLVLYFNEDVELNSSQNNLNYTVDLGVGNPAIATRDLANNSLVHLTFSNTFTNGTNYTLTINNIKDTANNTIVSISALFTYLVLDPPVIGDLIINEVLFNPFIGGSDFVELYNNSNKIINLKGWNLANLERDSIDNYKLITDTFRLIFPKEFILLSKDVYNISTEYVNSVESTFLKMTSFPTYNNDEGDVYLLDVSNQVIDYFHYSEDMHFPLLNNVEGVSLERINYNRPTNEITNWHSAAEAVGFATPGYENSQYQQQNDNDDEFFIDPLTFSPNNDGVDDVVNISYHFSDPGYVANVVVYDAKGRLVKKLIQNQLLSVKGIFSWDGVDENNEKARIGIYIIYIEAFDLTGNVKSFKRTAVLASQL